MFSISLSLDPSTDYAQSRSASVTINSITGQIVWEVAAEALPSALEAVVAITKIS